jgi:hypothetical protein
MLLYSYLCDAWFCSSQNGIQKSFEDEIQNSFTKRKKEKKDFSFIPSPSLAFGLHAQPAVPPPYTLSCRPSGHDGLLASSLLPFLRPTRAARLLGPA